MNAPISLAMQHRLDDAADAIEAENRRMAKQNAHKWIADSEFWREELLDSDLQYLADPLAEMLANLQDAINGDEAARSAIHRALHQIEKCAIPQAQAQLEEIYLGEDA